MSKPRLGSALSIVFLTAVMAQAAPTAAQPSIQHVQHFARPSSTDPSPIRLELSKFIDAQADLGETFRVRWNPGSTGLAAGAVLRFQYQQAHVKKMQVLEIRYPFSVRENRVATFEIAPKAVRRGGEVVAWCVELLQHGQRLAEKSSGFRK